MATTPNVGPNKPGSPSGPGGNAVQQLEKLCEIRDLLADPTTVESAFADIGCIFDPATGESIGRVLACKETDAQGGNVSIELVGIIPGQEPIIPYTGDWGLCDPTVPEVPFISQYQAAGLAAYPFAGDFVRSITVSVKAGSVYVQSAFGAATILAGDSFTWSEGNEGTVDVSNLSFTGLAGADFTLHGEVIQ